MRACPQCQEFVPHWHWGTLSQLIRWRNPRRIFLGSMCDPFGYGVHLGHSRLMVEAARVAYWHTCIMLTKCPERVGLVVGLAG